MPSETPPGAPPSSIPRDVTAADLLTLLERLPPGELAAVPLAAKRLTESFAELDELIRRAAGCGAGPACLLLGGGWGAGCV